MATNRLTIASEMPFNPSALYRANLLWPWTKTIYTATDHFPRFVTPFPHTMTPLSIEILDYDNSPPFRSHESARKRAVRCSA
ncbi:hypothetical protein [Luteibacter sp.]|jgi:hypothetical protein|uniref:hypothetical protein n=1 Tax=Luteibacter sp. TaxID=1886636 RepID=UPI002F3E206D